MCARLDQEKRRTGRRPPGVGVFGIKREWEHSLNRERTNPERPSGWPESMHWLLGILTIAIFIVTFVVQAFQIPSESMENTLLTGDYLLVDKVHFGEDDILGQALPYCKVRHGDIIVFHYPLDPRLHFVKRVVGIPGDHIRLINRQVYVNGVRAVEPYVDYFRPHDEFRDEFPRLDLPVSGLNGGWWLWSKKPLDNNHLIFPQSTYFLIS